MVTLIYRGKTYTLPAGSTLRDALKKLGLPTEAVLAVLAGQLITDDTLLQDGQTIKLVAVVSGGSAGEAA